ncbi:dihydroxyacetone kinase [Sporobolomyces salmoneus]|uniref:dihydroxyacetone kinase n=1 Tax=Sporobolomyces salmoneus TaxID=183962 RepID=UPI0031737256
MGKHILNSPKTAISDSLSGLAFLNPHTELYDTTLILRKPSSDQVHLVCGGGGGHEPAHASFVGKGMLSAAVSGQVFASPNARQVEKALDKLKNGKGTLVITKNYTGDVLQFGLAKERWAATHLGEDSVRMVVVGDDVAVPRSQGALTGRRGLAGTVLTYKIAGSLATKRASLDEVEFLAKLVSENCGTMGMGLEHCHVPGTEKSEEYLEDNQAEIGMGIHNEPGIRKVSPIPSAEKLVDEFLSTITNTEDKERSFLPFKNDGKDEVVLLVNNLGGLPELELGIVVKEAAQWLERKHITVQRAIAGSFMTSLNLPGFSLTLLLLPRGPVTPEQSKFESDLKFSKELVLECLDDQTEAPGWKWMYKGKPEMKVLEEDEKEKKKKSEGLTEESDVKGPKPTDSKLFMRALESALKSVIASEPEITRYDTIAGDGDAGLTLKAGATGILDEISRNKISDQDVVAAMVECSAVVEKEMGGTSGGLYAIGLSGLSKGLIQAAKEQGKEEATVEVWSRGLELALNTLYQYTRARPPSRTLIDPLSSFILTLGSNPSDHKTLVSAFSAAKEAAEATKDLDAKAGRAAYVNQDAVREASVPDAGAWGVWKLLEGVKEVLEI